MNFEKKKIEHWQVIAAYLLFFDIVAINASYFLALFLRFDLHYSMIPTVYLNALVKFAPVYTIFTVIVFYFFKLYNSLWRFASISELNRILAASLIVTVFQIVGMTFFIQRMPISYYIFGAVIQFVLVVAVRFSYRYVTMERVRREQEQRAEHRAMVIGAGQSGQMILKELKTSREIDAVPVCIIDDNRNKWGRVMEGIPVVGGRDDILDAVKKYKVDQILLAIPSASAEARRDILNICKETDCELKTLPGIYQLTNGEVSMARMKPVAVEDLLGRDTIKVNMDEIFNHLQGKVILVTGGGGSIGSELCRQIAGHGPKQLIIFDIYENNAYEIQQELKRKYPNLNLVVLIGSVRDSKRVNWVFDHYRPEIVYHAAAHKHVPLMEDSPNEAIKNNVIGTYKTAYAALKYGAERFVLISTDKAVNPTNVMGATKRMTELILQSRETEKPIRMAAVRFGNVLGSNGSVIPIFKEQIKQGGPVTITDKNIQRYFMTIPEAAQLVLQAGYYANHREIFVLDMGKPVKILDLAEKMISLSGAIPYKDIEIKEIGLRPGEKMFEELALEIEKCHRTENKLIFVHEPIDITQEEVDQKITSLYDVILRTDDPAKIKEVLLETIKDRMN